MHSQVASPRRQPRAAAAPLVLRGFGFSALGFSALGGSGFSIGASRMIGGASRTGLVSISPMVSPSAVISSRERANPGAMRFRRAATEHAE